MAVMLLVGWLLGTASGRLISEPSGLSPAWTLLGRLFGRRPSRSGSDGNVPGSSRYPLAPAAGPLGAARDDGTGIAEASRYELLAGASREELLAKLHQMELHRAHYVETVSHELRTPLTSIKGFAQLITRGEGSSRSAQNYAAVIAAEADRLVRIVNDLVDLIRMESGLLELHREPVQPVGLIAHVVESLHPKLPPELLRLSLPDRLPLVHCDSEMLAQAIRRLMADSVNRARPGSAVLLAAEEQDNGVRVCLEYQSTRVQLDELAEILRWPGLHGEGGFPVALGSGDIGLYISRNFIEAHGGRIWVDWSEDQVATVSCTLPGT